MASDIILRQTPREKEWAARKARVGAGLGEIGTFVLRKAKDILPDIRAIKEKELWREGGYNSFSDFTARMLDISRSQIYRLLHEDDETRKVLEIRESRVASCDNSALPPAQEAQEEEPQKKATKKPSAPPMKQAKAKEVSTQNNLPLSASPTGMSQATTVTVIERDGQKASEHTTTYGLPNSAKVIVTTTDSTRVCPHCGGAI